MTEGNDNLKMPEGNNNSKGIKGNEDICVSILCHSRALSRESRGEKNHYFLDTREGSEYDNFASSSLSSSCLTRRSRARTNYASAFRIAQSGRSMVEMLGVLAVIGYSAHSYRTGFAICK